MPCTPSRTALSGHVLACLVATVTLAGPFPAALAGDAVILDHRGPDVDYRGPGIDHRRPHRPPPFGIRDPQQFDPVRDVDVGVILPPEQLEHWRSNYVPDSYRLNGYDGVRQGEANVCRHDDGSRSYSSSGMTCEDGNANPPGGRTWSTK
ncbi:hypothetical protein SAMN05421848_2570 [Kushneria avicenniae]|uniref:Uncharacterized protein n=1 Tax=Kushneria avicenniae TaxID=402385 RepID=A0A1I1LXN4_9GAMM|nr:hypothetical protein [Kushneria avicenniae]SFC74220.1 hypothetical protein SAMN05421848_2570 [Kushneria avicenniae]